MNNSNSFLNHLKDQANELGEEVKVVANYLLEDPRFPIWSGSSLKSQHHYGHGGLVRHTYETVKLCFDNSCLFPEHNIDHKELFLAALFHDAGKLYDYRPNDRVNTPTNPYGEWEGTNHKRYIHHISRSALMWSEAARRSNGIYSNYHDKVLHAILAHHGSREAGSPVAPKSRVAWMVHLCDNLSARMCDAETWDILSKINKR